MTEREVSLLYDQAAEVAHNGGSIIADIDPKQLTDIQFAQLVETDRAEDFLRSNEEAFHKGQSVGGIAAKYFAEVA
jgi:hypothetical protein